MKNLTDFICESITIEQIEKSKFNKKYTSFETLRDLLLDIFKTFHVDYLLSDTDRHGNKIDDNKVKSNTLNAIERIADEEFIGNFKKDEFIALDTKALLDLWEKSSDKKISKAKLIYNKAKDILGYEYSIKGIFSGSYFIKFTSPASEILKDCTEKDLEVDGFDQE